MATARKTVSEMTMDELKRLVNDLIDERQNLPSFADQEEDLSWDDIRAFVDQHRVTLSPGAKTSLELLREDRDR